MYMTDAEIRNQVEAFKDYKNVMNVVFFHTKVRCISIKEMVDEFDWYLNEAENEPSSYLYKGKDVQLLEFLGMNEEAIKLHNHWVEVVTNLRWFINKYGN